jgi:hypothetical protein
VSDMQCRYCYGVVLWVGLCSNNPHTKCRSCGAINCHIPEDEEDDEDVEDKP